MGYRDFTHDFYEFLNKKRLTMSEDKVIKIKVQVYRDFIKEVAVYKVLPDVSCFLERAVPKYLPTVKGVR